MTISTRMKQIHLGLGPLGYLPVGNTAAGKNVYTLEHDAYETILLRKCPANVWPGNSYAHACPRPMLIDEEHQKQLIDFHSALTIAIGDIVKRWCSDKEAHFPERMPLEENEEKLLQVR